MRILKWLAKLIKKIMGTITLTTITNGDDVDATPVNNNFNTIKNTINGDLENANIKASAGIVYSKLNISAGDITYAKLDLSDSILNADINSSAAIDWSKISAPTLRTYVKIPGARSTTDTTYTNGDFHADNRATYFTFDKSKFGTVVAIYLQVNMYKIDGGTSYVRLYNATDTAEEVEVSTTSTDPETMVTSADIKATLPSAKKTYHCQIKSSASSSAYATSAYLIVDYKPA